MSNMNNNLKNIILIVLGISLLGITVAYASLSTRLNISGNANVQQTTWDVIFEDFSDASPANTTLEETNTGVIKNVSTNSTKITNFEADLKKPGDVVVYNFDIRNRGTIDARLQSFTNALTCTNQSACSNITYTVVCKDSSNNTINNNYVLAKNTEVNCSLSLLYNTNASIEDDITASVSADWIFIQN